MSLLLLFAGSGSEAEPDPPAEVTSAASADHIVIGYQNRVDASTITGGPTQAGLSLTNLKNRRLGNVARFTDADPVNTYLVFDLGTGKILRVIALVAHNLSQSAQYRIRVGDDATFTTNAVDTDWLDVWPTVYNFGEVPWGAENFWELKYAEEDIENLTWSLIKDLGVDHFNRYVRIDLSDPNNPAGYVQVGRPFIGRAWQPTFNMQYGASIGWEDGSGVSSSVSGGEFFDTRRPYRVQRFVTIEPEDEGMSQGFEISRRSGVTGEVVLIWNPLNDKHSVRRNFYGRNRTLNPIEYPFLERTSQAWEVKEGVP